MRRINARLTSRVRERLTVLRRRFPSPMGRPDLRYVEIHLADHCNLNCKGCGHFSPMADVRFIDLDQYSADLKRMSDLFEIIEEMRLMGGEPLLFPRINEAVALSRSFFSRTDLRIVTNGVLLTKMGEPFWKSCNENRVTIDLTKYPISLDMRKIREIADDWEVPIEVYECNAFFASLNVKGDSDPRAAMKKCRSFSYCPYLQDGKLYVCAVPPTVHSFNREFGTAIPDDGAIDIHSSVTGRRIIKLLERPIPACRYCTAGEYPTYAWTISRKSKDEWNAESNLAQIAPYSTG